MPEYLYAIGADTIANKRLPIKVGITVNPISRIRSLQAGSPVPLSFLCVWEVDPSGGIVSAEWIEAFIHENLGHKHSHGEWFFASLWDVKQSITLWEKIYKHQTKSPPTIRIIETVGPIAPLGNSKARKKNKPAPQTRERKKTGRKPEDRCVRVSRVVERILANKNAPINVDRAA